jgi:ADP-heptose:LPS heptosyltransferase
VLPAAHLVRDNFPDARITFLTSEEYSPLLRGFAGIDSVIPIDRALYRTKKPAAIWRATRELLGRLRSERFSLVVDFQGYGETGWLTRITGAPRRWGYVYRSCRGWPYTRGVRLPGDLHPVDRYRLLLVRCGLREHPVRNEFRLPETETRAAVSFFRDRGLDPARPTLFIQPFTSSPQKNWPLDKYLHLARIWRGHGLQVIFGGGPAERTLLRPVTEEGIPVAAGATLPTTAGLIAMSTLMIGGDTGLVHLAMAMGKRVVALSPPGCANAVLPYGHPEWAVEATAGTSLADVAVERVAGAVGDALQQLPVGAATVAGGEFFFRRRTH